MSGPIVRRYGFPNFEKIFGDRELKHGAEDGQSTSQTSPPPVEPGKATEVIEPTKADPKLSKP